MDTNNKDNTRYVFTLFSLTEDQLVCFNYYSKQGSPNKDLEEDSGLVFMFSDEINIHNCILLPSVATVAGTWGDQGVILSSPQPGT